RSLPSRPPRDIHLSPSQMRVPPTFFWRPPTHAGKALHLHSAGRLRAENLVRLSRWMVTLPISSSRTKSVLVGAEPVVRRRPPGVCAVNAGNSRGSLPGRRRQGRLGTTRGAEDGRPRAAIIAATCVPCRKQLSPMSSSSPVTVFFPLDH